MKFIALLLLAFSLNQLFCQTDRIFVDGSYSDWQSISPAYIDSTNDQITGEIDFNQFWISNDNHYLFLRIDIDSEISLQNDNQITLYIDSDNEISTGMLESGIGAELKFIFGMRDGIINLDGSNISIIHKEIGLVTSPTVTSNQFEIALKLDAEINGIELFSSNTIKLTIKDEGEGKDQIPNETGGISYQIKDEEIPGISNYSLAKANPNSIRFLSYNVLFDNLFDPNLEDEYSRILKSVNPDIIAFQEIYSHSAEETARLLNNIIPLINDNGWYYSSFESVVSPTQYYGDLVTLSKYPIKGTYAIEGYGQNTSANLATLIELSPEVNNDLLIINIHAPCCSKDVQRQEEIDKVMAFVRDAMATGGDLTLQKNTPILIVGDMNFVGDKNQLNTIITGDISDNILWGDDFQPDWDSTNLIDLKPFTTDLPMVFSWYDENSDFSPGRLDYIFYTGSVLENENSFAFFTPVLHPDTLSKFDLEIDDIVKASDHLPVVADFTIKNITSIKNNEIQPSEGSYKLSQNYPNPFNPVTTINYTIPTNINNELQNVKLSIFDLLGRKIETLVNEYQKPGNYQTVFDASNLTSGIYYYSLLVNKNLMHKKMILLK